MNSNPDQIYVENAAFFFITSFSHLEICNDDTNVLDYMVIMNTNKYKYDLIEVMEKVWCMVSLGSKRASDRAIL